MTSLTPKLGLQVLDFIFKSLDNFLTEVAPLGQLLFHFLVDLDIPFKSINLSSHLVILLQEYLSLLGLVLQLSCELMILQDGQPGRCLQLLIVQSEEVCLRLFDFMQHFLSQGLGSLYLVSLKLIHLILPQLLLVFQIGFQLVPCSC